MNVPATIHAPGAERARPLPRADRDPAHAARIGRSVTLRLASQAAAALINLAAMVLLGRTLSARGFDREVLHALRHRPVVGSLADTASSRFGQAAAEARIAHEPRQRQPGLLRAPTPSSAT